MSAITFRDRVANYLKSHPNVWVDGMTLAELGGQYAWRSRISDARTQLGMVIENRQRTVRDHSEGCPGIQAWDIPEACTCGRPKRYVISEYRCVPKSEPSQADLLKGVA